MSRKRHPGQPVLESRRSAKAMTEALGFLNASAALGIGLLVGLERERRKGEEGRSDFAGLRTFAVTSMLGYGTLWAGGALLLGFVVLALGTLVTLAYCKSRDQDPGITGEVAWRNCIGVCLRYVDRCDHGAHCRERAAQYEAAHSLSKCVAAWVSGGRRFAGFVIPGHVLMTLAMWGGLALPSP